MSKDKGNLSSKQDEILCDIVHQAQEITRMSVMCLSNQRIGREWLLKMQHGQERLAMMLLRLDREDSSRVTLPPEGTPK